jgi:hypothetical protein
VQLPTTVRKGIGYRDREVYPFRLNRPKITVNRPIGNYTLSSEDLSLAASPRAGVVSVPLALYLGKVGFALSKSFSDLAMDS